MCYKHKHTIYTSRDNTASENCTNPSVSVYHITDLHTANQKHSAASEEAQITARNNDDSILQHNYSDMHNGLTQKLP